MYYQHKFKEVSYWDQSGTFHYDTADAWLALFALAIATVSLLVTNYRARKNKKEESDG